MNKFTKAFKAFRLLIKKPHLLNLIIESEDAMQNYVAQTYGMPNGLKTVDILNFIQDEAEVSPYSFLEGSSLPTDFALLRSICKINKVEDYLEIGTWRGESAANVAPFVKNCVTINLPDEDMRKLGLPKDYIDMHRAFSKDLPNVTHIQANSQTFDFASLDKKFDLIFIDGDHHTASIINDTKNAFSLLKDDNSVIVWHDYGMGTETPRFNVLAGILDGSPADCIKNIYHVSHTLCALYTKKDVESRLINSNEKPEHFFKITLNVKHF